MTLCSEDAVRERYSAFIQESTDAHRRHHLLTLRRLARRLERLSA